MREKSITVPLAIFGKPEDAKFGCGYRFIARHRAFAVPKTDRALRRMVSAMEWKPSAENVSYVDVFGVMTMGDEMSLVARFSDKGRDSTGRPHTMEVCCLLWKGEVPRKLLEESVWDAAEISKTTDFRIALVDGAPVGDVVEGEIVLIGEPGTFACAEGVRVL